MIFGHDGNLYGTTFFGGFTDNNPGTLGLGTVFRVTPDGLFTSLVQFQGTNGSNPAAPLVLGNDGNLYGTTANGGPRRWERFSLPSPARPGFIASLARLTSRP